MVNKSLVLPLLGLGVTGWLTACNDDHDFNSNFGVDPSGVYEGTLTDTVTPQLTTPVFVIIDEDGDGRMAGTNGTYYKLNGISTSEDNVFAGLTGFSNNIDFPNGGLVTSGNLHGFVSQNQLHFNYTAQGNDSGSIALTLDDVYFQHSSLATLAGTYTSNSSTPTYNFTIQNSGALTGTDSNGCTYIGNFSLVDTHFNAYVESFSQTCGSTVITFSGQADFVGTPTPAQINLLADDNSGHFLYINFHQ